MTSTNGLERGTVGLLMSSHNGLGGFQPTRWSLVARAAKVANEEDAALALEVLCQAYWDPVYGFLRRSGHKQEDAEDLTQEFFASLLSQNTVAAADRTRGKFRTFLLAVLKLFLSRQREKANAQKRGGLVQHVSIDLGPAEDRYQSEIVDADTPETIFARRWANTVLELALKNLRESYAKDGKETVFEVIKHFLSWNEGETSYREAADSLSMTEANLKVVVHRMRKRYRRILHQQVAETLDTDDEAAVEDEMRSLFAALSGKVR